MFSHITVGCTDIQLATAFYDAVLEPLGLQRPNGESGDNAFFSCWHDGEKSQPCFFVVLPIDGNDATVGNGSMVAFVASTAEQVDSSYQSGLLCGGSDEGKPGPRPQYAKGYYGAYLRDPDGNKVHVVYRGDLQ